MVVLVQSVESSIIYIMYYILSIIYYLCVLPHEALEQQFPAGAEGPAVPVPVPVLLVLLPTVWRGSAGISGPSSARCPSRHSWHVPGLGWCRAVSLCSALEERL